MPVPAVLWVLGIFIVPTSLILGRSLLTYTGLDASPPFTLEAYTSLLGDKAFRKVLTETIMIAGLTAILTLLLGYPLARFLVFSQSRVKPLVVAIIVGPLVASVVVRTYGWLVLLEREGPLNQILLMTGVADHPVTFLGGRWTIVVGLVHVLLPFAVFTISSSLQNIDPNVEKASQDLGAGRVRSFLSVTLPLSLPGVMAGAILVFAISVGSYATPQILGRGRTQTLATLVQQKMLISLDWAQAAAIAVILLAIGLGAVALISLITRRWLRWDRA
jgi:putative spermidine/putrescine transport system permease protein